MSTDLHSLSKLVNASRSPSINPGNKSWQTSWNSPFSQHPSLSNESVEKDPLHVYQPEPPGFKRPSKAEHLILSNLTEDHHTKTADFYRRIESLKKEHEKTVAVLKELYAKADKRCHSLSLKDHIVTDEEMPALEHRFLERKDNGLHYDDTMTTSQGPLSFTMDTYFDENTKNSAESDDENIEHIENAVSASAVKSTSSVNGNHLVSKMWENFSIHDYSADQTTSGNRRPRSSSTPRKNAWSPVITIPKPFNMTIRDEQKKEKSHTRSSIEISRLLKEREEEERALSAKPIKAREIPAHTYLPMYEEYRERQEQRSRFNKENSYAMTKALQKPFSFAERDEKKRAEKKHLLKKQEKAEVKKIKKMSRFKASDVPKSVFDPTIDDQLIEDELYRKIKKKMRSEELYASSGLPPRMHAHQLMADTKRQSWRDKMEKETSCSFRPKTHDVPDFEKLHKKAEAEIIDAHSNFTTTPSKPFNLRTTERSEQRRGRIFERKDLDDSFEEEERPRSRNRLRKSTDALPTGMTEASRLRIQKMKDTLQEAERVIQELKKKESADNERKKVLAKKVSKKAVMNETQSSSPYEQDKKLKAYKKEMKKRDKEYNKFLSDVYNRVDARPLLFEQHNEKVAKAQAEKRYREILQSSGISDDLVDVNTSPNKSANDSYSREFVTLDEDNDDSDDDVDSLPLDQSTDIPSRTYDEDSFEDVSAKVDTTNPEIGADDVDDDASEVDSTDDDVSIHLDDSKLDDSAVAIVDVVSESKLEDATELTNDNKGDDGAEDIVDVVASDPGDNTDSKDVTEIVEQMVAAENIVEVVADDKADVTVNDDEEDVVVDVTATDVADVTADDVNVSSNHTSVAAVEEGSNDGDKENSTPKSVASASNEIEPAVTVDNEDKADKAVDLA